MDTKKRQPEDGTGHAGKTERARKGSPAVFVVISVIILIIVSWGYVPFLGTRLFEEQRSHIAEFADKASEIVGNVIEYSWQQASFCEYLLHMGKIATSHGFMVLTAVVIVITMASNADRQMVRQKDGANLLLAASAEGVRSASQAKSGLLSHMSRMESGKAGLNHEDFDIRICLENMNILLVEDVEPNLEIAQSILEEGGAVITPAMNGREAVDTFAGHPQGTFDAILMDIMMPVMDGITATKTIRAMDRPDAKTIPIIAMTANAYEEDIRRTREAGMDAHLLKPVDIDMLLKTMSRFYSMQKKHTGAIDLAGLNVLLADDVELNLEIAGEMLKHAGAVVTKAKNGQEAVDIFGSRPEGAFDIILMDVHMPVMDGIDATKAIRAMARPDAERIPILAMSADAFEEDIMTTKKAGMNAHLTKPFAIEPIYYFLSEFKGESI